MDWKAEYSALSSTRSQKKKLKQPTPVSLTVTTVTVYSDDVPSCTIVFGGN